jgi:hypothetical protein
MSVAHSGRLIRNLDQDRLRRVLRTLMRIDRQAGSGSSGTRLEGLRAFFQAPRTTSTDRSQRAGSRSETTRTP